MMRHFALASVLLAQGFAAYAWVTDGDAECLIAIGLASVGASILGAKR